MSSRSFIVSGLIFKSLSYVFDKGLISKIYKKFLQFNGKKPQITRLKSGIQMVHRYRCSTSVIIGEMQINPQ